MQVQEEAMKGVTFCEHQLGLWQGFSGRADGYVAAVRRQADELAIQGACVCSAVHGKGAGNLGRASVSAQAG